MIEKIKSIVKQPSILWNILGISAQSFYSVFLILFITRINGVEQSGVFSFIFYISSIFQTIGNYGGRVYQVSDVEGIFENNTYVSIKVVTATIMVFSSLLFCLINGYDLEKTMLMVILLGGRFFEVISEACFGILQKHNRLDIVGKSMFYKSVIATIVFVIINYITKNIQLASMSFVIVFATFFFMFDLKKTMEYSKIKLVLDEKVIRLAKKSFQVFLYPFLTILILNITRYFVDLNASNTAQGYFSILIMPASLISLFAQFLIQPMITTLVEKYNKGQSEFKKDCVMLLLALFSFGIVSAVISYFVLVDILSFLFNIPLTEFRLETALLIFAGVCNGGVSLISTILVIMRKLTAQTIAFCATLVTTILVSWYMVGTSISMALYAYMISIAIQFLFFIILFIYFLKKPLQSNL
jgi:O-antigen/teichoic acid export membrane protein